MNITITIKDLKKYYPLKVTKDGPKYHHMFSDSGMLIDELAYCAKQWTSEDLYQNNWEYEPNEPYMYDYEADLFEATKTADQLYTLAQTLEVSLNANWERLAKEQKLQTGACVALNNPESWNELLKAYTKKLQEDRTDGISSAYNDQLQEEIDSYNDDQYREWLNGDRSNYAGVVYEIAKYFTDERDGSYTKYDPKTKTEESYTFTLNEEDIEKYKDAGYRTIQIKGALIDEIISSGNAVESKHKADNEKRKAESERMTIHKAKQAEVEQAERIAKLQAMTFN